jgi:Fur family transcriptional regulator, ferric uptake regulator
MESQDLRKAGLKVTLPRVKILEILESNETNRHLSAEDVYKALLEEGQDIGLATVYRVLTQFEHAGILIRHHFDNDKAVYELNRGGHHDHLLCLQCGHVEEFFDEEIERRQHAIAKKHGFKLAEHALHLYVECERKNCPHRRKG